MTPPAPAFRVAREGDEALLDQVASGVLDHPVNPGLWREFLADPRHHLVVAIEDGVVIGVASGVHYVHPDKPAELFINEIGVAAARRGEGIGRRLLDALLEEGRVLGCRQAWVLADPGNAMAERLYRGADGQPSAAVMYTFPVA